MKNRRMHSCVREVKCEENSMLLVMVNTREEVARYDTMWVSDCIHVCVYVCVCTIKL